MKNFDNLNKKEEPQNDVKYFSKLKSIKLLFVSVIMIFLIILIIAIFICNFLVMNHLYSTINNNYLREFIIIPISNENENFTQSLNIRIKVMEEIIMESKLININLMTDFVFKNEIEFQSQEIIETNLYPDLTLFNKDKLKKFYIGLNLLEGQSLQQSQYFHKKFKSLAYFLILMQKNYFIPFDITEIMIIQPYKLNYLLYSSDAAYSRNILLDSFEKSQKWSNTQEYLKKYGFVDYMVENIYSKEGNVFNYVKLHSLNTITSDKQNNTFLIMFRLNNKELRKVFNTVGNNMTVLYKHERFNSDSFSFNFLPISNYMESFFEYGITARLSQKNIASDLLLLQPKYSDRQAENYYISNFDNYFRILNYQDSTGKYDQTNFKFNNNFHLEFLAMSGIFNKILKSNFQYDIYKKMGVNVDSTECRKMIQNFSNMTCDILEFDQNIQLKKLNFGIDFDNSTKSDISFYYNNTLNKKFGNAHYYESGGIFTSIRGRTFEKKFFIYENNMNNLEIVGIDMVSMEQYFDIEENFIINMDFYSSMITYLLILFSIIVFFVSLVITIKSVSSVLKRIKMIRNIKINLFYKDEFLHRTILSENFIKNRHNFKRVNHLENIAQRCLNKEISDKEKLEILEKDSFEEQLVIIICDSKKKLIKVLSKIDNGKIYLILFKFNLETDPEFLDRLNSFQRRSRLRI